MGFSQFLEGQANNAFNQEMQRNQMTMNQGGQGMNINMNMAGQNTNRNIGQQQMENSAMNSANQMAMNQGAANQQMWGNLIGTGVQGYQNWAANRNRGLGAVSNQPPRASYNMVDPNEREDKQ
jgi:hypothetical protein